MRDKEIAIIITIFAACLLLMIAGCGGNDSAPSTTAQYFPLSTSSYSSTSPAASPIKAASTSACSNAPCIDPSQRQADSLFAKIEQTYPQYFSSSTGTQAQQSGNDNIYYRLYNNSGNIGLGTYQGGLWYNLGQGWTRYSSLDDANRLFCNFTCWSGASFNITQSISDEAQNTTIAFSAMAMMTGNIGAQSFFPPGKIADYTGFQYLRDNDPDNMGHNTSFLTRVAENILYILNDAQMAQLATLAKNQTTDFNLYGAKRFPLMNAFRRLMDGSIPSGTTGLSLTAIKAASKDLYLIDGQVSYDRAVLYSSVLNSLTTTQKAYLAAMKGKGWKSWPDTSVDPIKSAVNAKKSALGPSVDMVAIYTYASDLYSWYNGSLEADVYFCPERHGTYYGSFFMKDAPAIGHEGYSIDEQLTATAGRALSDSSYGYVDATQAALMSSLVDTQRSNLYARTTTLSSGVKNNIVAIRLQIATLLRMLLTTSDADGSIKAQVLDLSAAYGELDGENNYNYATVMANLYKTLSAAQKTKLMTLRASIMKGTYADGTSFDFTYTATPYLYSAVIANETASGYIGNTDGFFR